MSIPWYRVIRAGRLGCALVALVVPWVLAAQTAVPSIDTFVGKCVELRPENATLFQRWRPPRFARLEATQYRQHPSARWMRVATPIGIALDSAVRRYEREANWHVDADSVRLVFSTGFTVLHFAFARARSDTLQGLAWVWNDDGPTTTFGGVATLQFTPCERLTVP